MTDFITNHPILIGAIVLFIVAAVFMAWEMRHAPFDPEEGRNGKKE